MISGGDADSGLADIAFEEMYAAWAPQLLRYLTWLEADPAIVEDAVQETMVSAWRYWPILRTYASPRGWLFKVAPQRLSRLRAQRHAEALRGEVPELDRPVEPVDLAQVDDRMAIVHLVRKLPPHKAAAVVLPAMGFSDQEIGEQLGIAGASVRRYRCVALRTLKDLAGQSSADQREEGAA